jgi:hypothetical protein
LENTGSAEHTTGYSTSFCLVETGSTGFKTGPTGFCTVHLFLKILVQPDTQPDTQPVFVWWKQVQPVFALFTFFCQSAVSAKKLCAAF